MDGSAVTKTVQLHPSTSDQQLHIDFSFMGLKFHKSSRMGKRWLAFILKRRMDTLITLYTQPSIILSRKHEQYVKAYEILTGRVYMDAQPSNQHDSASAQAAPESGMVIASTSAREGSL